MLISICDECGKPATCSILGMTGRVLIDGVDNNLQGCDLCDDHKPVPEHARQPNNCVHVTFYWPGRPPEEEEYSQQSHPSGVALL